MNKLELVEHIAKEAELTKVSAAAALEPELADVAKVMEKLDWLAGHPEILERL